MTSRPEDLLMGLVSLGLVPWIVWTVARGFASARLPVGRAFVERAERPRAFTVLLAAYVAAALLMGFIGLDLLFDLER